MATSTTTTTTTNINDNNNNNNNNNNKSSDILLHEVNLNGRIVKVNEYEMICILGEGQYGKVFLVEDESKKRYAMKLLKRHNKRIKSNGRGLIRNDDNDIIMNEVNIMKSLSHPHIVNLIAFINDPNSSSNVYLVIDYVDGGPVMIINGLTEYGTPKFVCPVEGTVLGESRSCSLAAQIFDAMAYLHSHKVAHRDIKMDNILLDLDGNIRVADFGVSHSFEGISDKNISDKSSKAICTDTAGTFSFWCPQILEDKDEGYDAFAADVWATGIVLWCFLFGELPYHSLDAESLFESISSGVPKIPLRKSPECEDILSKMLTYDAEKRITFNELLKHIWITEHDEAESESNVNVAKNMKSKLLKLKSHASGTVTERRRSLKFQKEESIQKLSQKLKSESLIQISETIIEAENINNEEIKKDHIENEKVNNVCCVII